MGIRVEMSKSDPHREKFVKSIRALLLRAGFDKSEVAIRGPTERGPDIIVTAREKDRTYKILIQCKWAEKAGREFKGLDNLIEEYQALISDHEADAALLTFKNYVLPPSFREKRKMDDVKQKDRIIYWDDNVITYYRRMIGTVGKPYSRHIILERLKVPVQKAYFHSIRYSFPLSICLFLISLCTGYSLSEQFPVGMLEMIREIFVGIEEWHSGLWLMILIFLNNSVKSLLVILFGFILGIVPLLFVAINGFIVGLGVKLSGLPFALAATLPHGIIEIPMVLLSSAIGIRIGYEAVNKMRGEGSIERELRRGIKFFALRVLPLLLLAAIIEAFVTPLIIDFLF